MDKIKKILKKIANFLIGFLAGIIAFFLFFFSVNKKKNTNAEKVREEKEDEIKKMAASDVISNSPNPDVISANIKHEQDNLRQRIRDKLSKNIY